MDGQIDRFFFLDVFFIINCIFYILDKKWLHNHMVSFFDNISSFLSQVDLNYVVYNIR